MCTQPALAKKPDSQKRACAKAYEDGQTLRSKGKLLAAREALLVCSQEKCPKAITRDCIDWLAEIEKSVPTIVIEARDASERDLTQVSVMIDGVLVQETLDGKSRPIDPGPHRLRANVEGAPSEELAFVAAEGDKNKKLTVRFQLGAPVVAATSTAAKVGARTDLVPPPETAAPERRSGEVPLVTWVAAGASLVAVGSFAFFGMSARSGYKALEDDCGPECDDDDELAAVKRDAVIADISLITALVAAGVGIVSYALEDSP